MSTTIEIVKGRVIEQDVDVVVKIAKTAGGKAAGAETAALQLEQ